MESVVVWFIFIMTMFSLTIVYADYQVDALKAFKLKITDDPNGITRSWDETREDPYTWFPITCDNANHVTRIDLGGASLSGQLAPELGQLKYLQYLELYNNNLDGQIPEEIGGLLNLINLDLYSNRFSGPIPGSLGNLGNLQNLSLYENNLDGQIPEEIGYLSNLKSLDLHNNRFSGPIPGSLTNLVNLAHLELYNNTLDGQILEEIGYLSNLISLDLHNNRLSGPVPNSLENLVNLQYFRIDNNMLTGPIPLALPCLNLTEVFVSGNNLCGPFTARCIDRHDPTKCTDDLLCPCRCGKNYNKPCDLLKTPLDRGRCCLKKRT